MAIGNRNWQLSRTELPGTVGKTSLFVKDIMERYGQGGKYQLDPASLVYLFPRENPPQEEEKKEPEQERVREYIIREREKVRLVTPQEKTRQEFTERILTEAEIPSGRELLLRESVKQQWIAQVQTLLKEYREWGTSLALREDTEPFFVEIQTMEQQLSRFKEAPIREEASGREQVKKQLALLREERTKLERRVEEADRQLWNTTVFRRLVREAVAAETKNTEEELPLSVRRRIVQRCREFSEEEMRELYSETRTERSEALLREIWEYANAPREEAGERRQLSEERRTDRRGTEAAGEADGSGRHPEPDGSEFRDTSTDGERRNPSGNGRSLRQTGEKPAPMTYPESQTEYRRENRPEDGPREGQHAQEFTETLEQIVRRIQDEQVRAAGELSKDDPDFDSGRNAGAEPAPWRTEIFQQMVREAEQLLPEKLRRQSLSDEPEAHGQAADDSSTGTTSRQQTEPGVFFDLPPSVRTRLAEILAELSEAERNILFRERMTGQTQERYREIWESVTEWERQTESARAVSMGETQEPKRFAPDTPDRESFPEETGNAARTENRRSEETPEFPERLHRAGQTDERTLMDDPESRIEYRKESPAGAFGEEGERVPTELERIIRRSLETEASGENPEANPELWKTEVFRRTVREALIQDFFAREKPEADRLPADEVPEELQLPEEELLPSPVQKRIREIILELSPEEREELFQEPLTQQAQKRYREIWEFANQAEEPTEVRSAVHADDSPTLEETEPEQSGTAAKRAALETAERNQPILEAAPEYPESQTEYRIENRTEETRVPHHTMLETFLLNQLKKTAAHQSNETAEAFGEEEKQESGTDSGKDSGRDPEENPQPELWRTEVFRQAVRDVMARESNPATIFASLPLPVRTRIIEKILDLSADERDAQPGNRAADEQETRAGERAADEREVRSVEHTADEQEARSGERAAQEQETWYREIWEYVAHVRFRQEAAEPGHTVMPEPAGFPNQTEEQERTVGPDRRQTAEYLDEMTYPESQTEYRHEGQPEDRREKEAPAAIRTELESFLVRRLNKEKENLEREPEPEFSRHRESGHWIDDPGRRMESRAESQPQEAVSENRVQPEESAGTRKEPEPMVPGQENGREPVQERGSEPTNGQNTLQPELWKTEAFRHTVQEVINQSTEGLRTLDVAASPSLTESLLRTISAKVRELPEEEQSELLSGTVTRRTQHLLREIWEFCEEHLNEELPETQTGSRQRTLDADREYAGRQTETDTGEPFSYPESNTQYRTEGQRETGDAAEETLPRRFVELERLIVRQIQEETETSGKRPDADGERSERKEMAGQPESELWKTEMFRRTVSEALRATKRSADETGWHTDGQSTDETAWRSKERTPVETLLRQEEMASAGRTRDIEELQTAEMVYAANAMPTEEIRQIEERLRSEEILHREEKPHDSRDMSAEKRLRPEEPVSVEETQHPQASVLTEEAQRQERHVSAEETPHPQERFSTEETLRPNERMVRERTQDAEELQAAEMVYAANAVRTEEIRQIEERLRVQEWEHREESSGTGKPAQTANADSVPERPQAVSSSGDSRFRERLQTVSSANDNRLPGRSEAAPFANDDKRNVAVESTLVHRFIREVSRELPEREREELAEGKLTARSEQHLREIWQYCGERLQAAAKQADAGRTNAGQTDAARTYAGQMDAEQTNAAQAGTRRTAQEAHPGKALTESENPAEYPEYPGSQTQYRVEAQREPGSSGTVLLERLVTRILSEETEAKTVTKQEQEEARRIRWENTELRFLREENVFRESPVVQGVQDAAAEPAGEDRTDASAEPPRAREAQTEVIRQILMRSLGREEEPESAIRGEEPLLHDRSRQEQADRLRREQGTLLHDRSRQEQMDRLRAEQQRQFHRLLEKTEEQEEQIHQLETVQKELQENLKQEKEENQSENPERKLMKKLEQQLRMERLRRGFS